MERKTELNIEFGLLYSDDYETMSPYDRKSLYTCNPLESYTETRDVGERILQQNFTATPYNLPLGVDVSYTMLCVGRLTHHRMRHFLTALLQGFRHTINVEGFPVVSGTMSEETPYQIGVPLGFISKDAMYMYNHYVFELYTHKETLAPHESRYGMLREERLVGVEVTPISIDYHRLDPLQDQMEGFPITEVTPLHIAAYKRNRWELFTKFASETDEKVSTSDGAYRVVHSYEVKWKETDIPTRAKFYEDRLGLANLDERATNSIVWAAFVFSVAFYFVLYLWDRVQCDSSNDAQGDLPSDISFASMATFPPPVVASVFAGLGSQILLAGVSVLAVRHFQLMPEIDTDGKTLTLALVLWCTFGVVCGYVSSKLYRGMLAVEPSRSMLQIHKAATVFVPSLVLFVFSRLLFARGDYLSLFLVANCAMVWSGFPTTFAPADEEVPRDRTTRVGVRARLRSAFQSGKRGIEGKPLAVFIVLWNGRLLVSFLQALIAGVLPYRILYHHHRGLVDVHLLIRPEIEWGSLLAAVLACYVAVAGISLATMSHSFLNQQKSILSYLHFDIVSIASGSAIYGAMYSIGRGVLTWWNCVRILFLSFAWGLSCVAVGVISCYMLCAFVKVWPQIGGFLRGERGARGKSSED